MLKVKNIETYYGPILAIRGVSLEVKEPADGRLDVVGDLLDRFEQTNRSIEGFHVEYTGNHPAPGPEPGRDPVPKDSGS